MVSSRTQRVAIGIGTTIAVTGQALAGLLYVATYTTEPIGNDAGFAGRSSGLSDSGTAHVLILLAGFAAIVATIVCASASPTTSRPFRWAGLAVAVIGLFAALHVSNDLDASGGGLAVLPLGGALRAIQFASVATALGFLVTWTQRDDDSSATEPRNPSVPA